MKLKEDGQSQKLWTKRHQIPAAPGIDEGQQPSNEA